MNSNFTKSTIDLLAKQTSNISGGTWKQLPNLDREQKNDKTILHSKMVKLADTTWLCTLRTTDHDDPTFNNTRCVFTSDVTNLSFFIDLKSSSWSKIYKDKFTFARDDITDQTHSKICRISPDLAIFDIQQENSNPTSNFLLITGFKVIEDNITGSPTHNPLLINKSTAIIITISYQSMLNFYQTYIVNKRINNACISGQCIDNETITHTTVVDVRPIRLLNTGLISNIESNKQTKPIQIQFNNNATKILSYAHEYGYHITPLQTALQTETNQKSKTIDNPIIKTTTPYDLDWMNNDYPDKIPGAAILNDAGDVLLIAVNPGEIYCYLLDSNNTWVFYTIIQTYKKLNVQPTNYFDLHYIPSTSYWSPLVEKPTIYDILQPTFGFLSSKKISTTQRTIGPSSVTHTFLWQYLGIDLSKPHVTHLSVPKHSIQLYQHKPQLIFEPILLNIT